MRLAMIGLGRMGANMVHRLVAGGHECVVYDHDPSAIERVAQPGVIGVHSLAHALDQLPLPRIVWVMLPAGEITEDTIEQLRIRLDEGDIIVDGGNTHFKDDIRRARALQTHGIRYLDVGTSGGVWGRERGYCLMVGGPRSAFDTLEPVLRTLAPGRGDLPPSRGAEASSAQHGFLHCGDHGAGHFVKMVHNGIEYGLMQAYAEGFALMRSDDRLGIDVREVAELWRRGSVVSSWLLDLTAMALWEDPDLEAYEGIVRDSGEGRWTVQTAVESGVPIPVLASALFARFRSQNSAPFADKLLSALRHQFGGHTEPTST